MPVMDGLTATRQILALPDPPQVAVLTTFHVDEYVYAALAAGAAGFLLKDTPPREIAAAVRAVADGTATLSPEVTATLIESYVDKRAAPRRAAGVAQDARSCRTASGRCCGCWARGESNAELAKRLFVSEATVKTYVSRLLTKLDLANRTQAAILAHEAGPARGRRTGPAPTGARTVCRSRTTSTSTPATSPDEASRMERPGAGRRRPDSRSARDQAALRRRLAGSGARQAERAPPKRAHVLSERRRQVDRRHVARRASRGRPSGPRARGHHAGHQRRADRAADGADVGVHAAGDAGLLRRHRATMRFDIAAKARPKPTPRWPWPRRAPRSGCARRPAAPPTRCPAASR